MGGGGGGGRAQASPTFKSRGNNHWGRWMTFADPCRDQIVADRIVFYFYTLRDCQVHPCIQSLS